MEDFEDFGFDEEGHKKLIAQAKQDALRAVEAMNLPKQVNLSSESFIGLGNGLAGLAQRILTQLTDVYGEKIPDLIGIALRESHYAISLGAYYLAATGPESLVESERAVQSDGRASTLASGFDNLYGHTEQETFLIDTPIQERPSIETLLNSMALYWFSMASSFTRSGDTVGAQDWIFEGYDAVNLAEGLAMFDGGYEGSRLASEEFEKEGIKRKAMLSAAGKRGVARKNEPIRQLKAWAVASAKGMKEEDKEIARILFRQIPDHLINASTNAERLIYDTLRDNKNPKSKKPNPS